MTKQEFLECLEKQKYPLNCYNTDIDSRYKDEFEKLLYDKNEYAVVSSVKFHDSLDSFGFLQNFSEYREDTDFLKLREEIFKKLYKDYANSDEVLEDYSELMVDIFAHTQVLLNYNTIQKKLKENNLTLKTLDSSKLRIKTSIIDYFESPHF